MNEVYIFCDGGSRLKKGLGSFSSITIFDDISREVIIEELSLDRGFYDVTNNQMELSGFIGTATVFFLKMWNKMSYEPDADIQYHISVISDSQYLVRGVNEYLPNWKKNGYKTAARKPIKNRELWQQVEDILEMYPNVTFEFLWTKGHNEISEAEMDYATKYNNMCDENCNRIMDSMEAGTYTTTDMNFPNFMTSITTHLTRMKNEGAL